MYVIRCLNKSQHDSRSTRFHFNLFWGRLVGGNVESVLQAVKFNLLQKLLSLICPEEMLSLICSKEVRCLICSEEVLSIICFEEVLILICSEEVLS